MDKKLLLKLAKMVMKFEEIVIDGKSYYTEGNLAEGVEILDENGDFLADGEYIVDTNKIVVKDGKIESIVEIEETTEETTTEEQTEQPIEQEEETTEQTEEQPADTEKDEKDLRIEELEGLLKDRDAIIEELNARIKELEEKKEAPLEDPIDMNKTITEKDSKGALKYFQN